MAIPNLSIRGRHCSPVQVFARRPRAKETLIHQVATATMGSGRRDHQHSCGFQIPSESRGNGGETTALAANARMLAGVSVIRAALRGPPECTLCLDALQAAGED